MCALLRFMLRLTLIAAAALVLPRAAAGQTGLATVTGILSDESGASLPGVTVVVTNQATNIAYTGVTNQAGNYIITSVPIGTYVVSVSLPGFKSAQSTVTLSAAQTARVDFKLAIGTVEERLEVIATSAVLQTENAVVGTKFERDQIEQPPVQGRNMSAIGNLLYRVVPAPDPRLDLTLQLGTTEFPTAAAGNPYEFAALVRAKLGDDKRLVRIYGTNTVIARLTGDRTRAPLFLLSYAASRRPQRGNLQAMRVRVLGRYQPTLAAYGAEQDTALTDPRNPENATEFWVPDFSVIAMIDLKAAQ
jgi:hypothetical protein